MIDALPALNRTDATFKTDVDTFFGTDLPAFSVQAEDARVQINSNTTIAQTQADLASAQVSLAQAQTLLATQQAQAAASSALSAGAIAWVSGTTYAIGNLRYSPINSQVYRRLTAGAGTTDPSLDATNWIIVNGIISESINLPSNNLPVMRPSLSLDFVNNQSVDPRITFTRTSTATRTNSKGLIEVVDTNVPRIDFDAATGICRGLLIEESRTNLLTYSENFDNAAWLVSFTTISPNVLLSPDGTLNADKLIEDASLNFHTRYQTKSVTSGTAYTLSVYAKAGERTFLTLTAGNTTTLPARATFNLVTGSVASTEFGTSSIKNVGNGWYFCSITATATATASTGFNIALTNGTSYVSYTGDGTSGIYVWGAQLEAGAFPTSYIPTVASQVTRAADVASMTGANFSSWYRQDEGSFVVDAVTVNPIATGNRRVIALSDGTTSERIVLNLGSTGVCSVFGVDNSVTQFTLTDAEVTVSNVAFKSSSKYKLNDTALSVNGKTVLTDTSATIPTVDRLQIGHQSNIEQINGHIRSLTYYPKALTSAELQALSTQ